MEVKELAANHPSKGVGRFLVIAFADFQCPDSRKCNEAFSRLFERDPAYLEKITFVFRHLPLDFHEFAFGHAVLAEKAFRRGGNELFWELHDELFKALEAYSEEDAGPYEEKVAEIRQRHGLTTSVPFEDSAYRANVSASVHQFKRLFDFDERAVRTPTVFFDSFEQVLQDVDKAGNSEERLKYPSDLKRYLDDLLG
jgi:hypothetical protein